MESRSPQTAAVRAREVKKDPSIGFAEVFYDFATEDPEEHESDAEWEEEEVVVDARLEEQRMAPRYCFVRVLLRTALLRRDLSAGARQELARRRVLTFELRGDVWRRGCEENCANKEAGGESRGRGYALTGASRKFRVGKVAYDQFAVQ